MKHYHINLSKEDLKGARHMFIVGDPARTEAIAQHLQDPQELTFNREYRTFLAYIDENPVIVASMGIGGPSTAVGLEEFGRCQITTVIRVGTSGILNPQVKLGDIVSAIGAIRDEGTTKQYLPPEFPAVAHPDVIFALRQGAYDLNLQDRFHEGIVHSKDAFWSEEPEMIPAKKDIIERWETWKRGQTLITEMEVSTLFILGSIRGWKTGAIMAAIGDFDTGDLIMNKKAGHVESIKTAIAGMQDLLNQ
ncbi:MAG: nucleoside phosphorylase [Candidatus Heimdallarchaeota archaeon]|nr:MAG: nucleoside phosphorylase [Candidatus Heimdallarchaeota archaeon]